MAGKAPTIFVPKGASTNKPLSFFGKDFYYWKGRMKLFLESKDVDLWDIIKIDSYKPTRRNQARVEINKPKAEWTQEEKPRVLLNSRAMFFLKCALSESEYDKQNNLELLNKFGTHLEKHMRVKVR